VTKKFRPGAILSPVVLAQREFNDQGEYVPVRHTVSVVTEVREPGKPVSQVVHHMPPELARRRAAELLQAAEEAETKNQALKETS
jgi:hypothetical protein